MFMFTFPVTSLVRVFSSQLSYVKDTIEEGRGGCLVDIWLTFDRSA